MTKDEALKMAIEALLHHTEQTRPIEDTNKAIQACKKALAQPTTEQSSLVQEPKSPTILARLPNGTTASNVYEAYEAGLKEGKAETQEPVAWRWIGLHGYAFEVKNPFAKDSIEHQHKYEVTPLYTTPPSREWVGLSDDEIEEGFRGSWVTKQAFESLVWWAEAKLKEKNT